MQVVNKSDGQITTIPDGNLLYKKKMLMDI